MHMMSKNKLSSVEMDTVRRSRNPAVVLTANGEVQTNEEAQVSVHDLHLFVTVQLLEETPAVLSLGKHCEDHGYSCEWVSGQKPRFTKDGKSVLCQADNFVPLVVPGLSAILEPFRLQHRSTGLVEKRDRNGIQEPGATCFKFIFRFSIRAK